MRPRRRTPLSALNLGAAVTALAVGAVAGCGGGSSADPQKLLDQARVTLDAAPSLHFALDSDNVPSSGTVLTGGDGDVERPDKFRGTLHAARSGVGFSIDVISVGGTVYLKLPFTSSYAAADPSKYGFSDPGALLNPDTGLSQLLSEAGDVKSAGQERVNGELLEKVDVTIPGTAVDRALTSADPSKPVTGTLSINPDSHELRRAVLTGPFLDKDVQTTFTVVLTDYGEDVSISAP